MLTLRGFCSALCAVRSACGSDISRSALHSAYDSDISRSALRSAYDSAVFRYAPRSACGSARSCFSPDFRSDSARVFSETHSACGFRTGFSIVFCLSDSTLYLLRINGSCQGQPSGSCISFRMVTGYRISMSEKKQFMQSSSPSSPEDLNSKANHNQRPEDRRKKDTERKAEDRPNNYEYNYDNQN